MMNIKTILLVNPGFVADEYWVVRIGPDDQKWDVRGIDIYWDRERKILKAEDVQIDDLPKAVQDGIIIELEHRQVEKLQYRYGLQRLMADIQAQAPRPKLELVDGGAA